MATETLYTAGASEGSYARALGKQTREKGNRMSLAMRTLAILIAVLLTSQAHPALADYPYNGTGQWTTSSLYYYFYGPDAIFQSPTQAAATNWSDMTDLTVSATAQDWEKIGVFTGAYGQGTFTGRTTICVVSGGCTSTVPIDSNYSYAQIELNTSIAGSFSWGQQRALVSHEFGHTFSLFHSFYCDPRHIMYPADDPSCRGMTADSHAAAGINARY